MNRNFTPPFISGRHRTPLIRQNETSECSLACLAMVAGHHGYLTDLHTLRQRYNFSLKGATLKQTMDVAEAMGFSARPLRGDLDDLQHLALPAILHWNLNHFVVLTRITQSFKGVWYFINDPARGELKLSREEISAHFTGVALELIKSEVFLPKVERAKLGITQLWSSMTGFWEIARSVLVLSIILQVFALAAPFFLQIAIDTVAPAADRNLLLMLAIGFGGISIINLIAGWLRSTILVTLNSSLSYQIVVNLFRHLMRLPLPWFEKRHVGDVVSRFGATQPITQLLSEGLVASIIDGFMAILTLALMFAYSAKLAGLALTALSLYVVLRLLSLHTMRLRNIDTITLAARESSIFIESVRGILAIKAFGQEGNRQRLWQKAKAESINANIKVGRLSAAFSASNQFILAIERVIFVYLAVSLVIDGDLTIGMIFALQSYKQQFLDTSLRLVEQGVNASLMGVHLERLSDIALTKTEDNPYAANYDRPDFSTYIEMRGVGFKYGTAENDVLKNVDLRVDPGEMIVLVGPSGGGKTTLLKIMMGLFEPTKGKVYIGDRPLRSFSKSVFRSRIGVVSQEDSLYAGSLAENISFFDPELDMDRVLEVAKLAAIHYDIVKMPLRYDTLVGDMGSTLSGGQKQRVLLARALYNRPEILFMDEGTANLDPVSEQRIVAALSSLSITRVLVAHRPALIAASDRILLCAKGTVKEVGKDFCAA